MQNCSAVDLNIWCCANVDSKGRECIPAAWWKIASNGTKILPHFTTNSIDVHCHLLSEVRLCCNAVTLDDEMFTAPTIIDLPHRTSPANQRSASNEAQIAANLYAVSLAGRKAELP